MQRFSAGARVLTDKETKAFLSAADDDSDGKIGADGNYGFYIIFPSFIINRIIACLFPFDFYSSGMIYIAATYHLCKASSNSNIQIMLSGMYI